MPFRLPPLLCPVCREALAPVPASAGATRSSALSCRHGHSFDAAKQGYFNLLVGKGTAFEADTAEMVAARTAFLDAGVVLEIYRAQCEKSGHAHPDVIGA